MSLVRSIVSDIINHKHTHVLTLGLVFTIWTHRRIAPVSTRMGNQIGLRHYRTAERS